MEFFEKTWFCAQKNGEFDGFKMVANIFFFFQRKLETKTFQMHSTNVSGDKIRLPCAFLKSNKFFEKSKKIEEKNDFRRKIGFFQPKISKKISNLFLRQL